MDADTRRTNFPEKNAGPNLLKQLRDNPRQKDMVNLQVDSALFYDSNELEENIFVRQRRFNWCRNIYLSDSLNRSPNGTGMVLCETTPKLDIQQPCGLVFRILKRLTNSPISAGPISSSISTLLG
jgi:hypothetical protein